MQLIDVGQKLDNISLSIIDSITDRCRCGFVRDRLSDEVFQCFDASPQAVTYHAVLHGTASATSSQLISHIEQWTTEGATITVQHTQLKITRTCAVTVPSFAAGQQCPGEVILTDKTTIPALIIGSTAAATAVAVITIIIIIVVVITAALVINKRQKHQNVR